MSETDTTGKCEYNLQVSPIQGQIIGDYSNINIHSLRAFQRFREIHQERYQEYTLSPIYIYGK
jgi:hypothetical protein